MLLFNDQIYHRLLLSKLIIDTTTTENNNLMMLLYFTLCINTEIIENSPGRQIYIYLQSTKEDYRFNYLNLQRVRKYEVLY